MLTILHFIQFQLVVISIYICLSKNDFTTIIASSVFSILSVILYVIMHATDLATTEAAIGLSLSTALYMITILSLKSYKKNIKETEERKLNYSNGIIIAICMLGLYISFVKMLPTISKNKAIEEYYIDNTKKDYKFDSMVTSIVAGYRGFDTLFETLVIFVAGIGVYSILVGDRKDKTKGHE